MNREQMVEKAAVALFESPDYLARKGIGVDDARTVIDAILPQVSTVAELEALPDGCLLVDDWGAAFRTPTRSKAVERKPLTVVWQPEVTA